MTTEQELDFQHQVNASIDYGIEELVRGGFITEEDSRFIVNPLIEKLESVLHISLTRHATTPHDAISVSPVFRTRAHQLHGYDVFVLMPFAEELLPVFADHIKNVCSRLNLSVGRADDIFTTNSVIDDVWTGIMQAQIVVADCTHRNPNVFYELGITHTIGKPVILISQDTDDVPFDVRHRRCIVYDFTPRGMERFEVEFTATIQQELRLNLD